jgi:hypothetical protein
MSGILIFLHIPKTAGTSFNHILRDIYGKSFYRVKPGGKWRKAKRLPVSTRCVTGHMPYGIHKKWKLEDFQYVTLLRYPVDRIISLWWFARKNTRIRYHRRARKLNLAQFSKCRVISELDNGMVRRLSGNLNCGVMPFDRKVNREDLSLAKFHLEQMLYGFTDTLKYDVSRFASALEWPFIPGLQHKMAGKGTPQYEPAELEKVMEANLLDVELYNWALSHRGID